MTIIEIDGRSWERHPIKTHFITPEDKLEDIVQKYILPASKPGDVVALGQKIISILQNKIVYRKDVKVGFWARCLSKFAKKTPHGFSVGNPLKMQVAIDLAGLPRIFLAGLCSFVCKLFGVSGVFYIVAGNQINQIDGFYGQAFPQYADMGILGPENCDKLCADLKEKYGLSFFVADVNDLGGNVLGKTPDLEEEFLIKVLKDNPAGQSDEQTPIVIIRNESAK
ncbi:F420-0--gamma-glutamyl ligase [Patescibacteria group bacterium]|nr:F420-0--gamma-glutamyl ligase [Patescibacteria group bacterium]